MSSDFQQVPRGLSAPLFQGTHITENREIIGEITVDSLDQIIGELDELSNLWEDYRPSSIRGASEAQQKLNIVFEIGLGWKLQRDAFRTQFSGSTQEFTDRLETDKVFHSRVAEICAAEAMLSVCYMFVDALATLRDEEDGQNGAQAMKTSEDVLFSFAGTVESRADFELQFVNQKVLPWIESHGQDALSSSKLEDIEHLRINFWQKTTIEIIAPDQITSWAPSLGTAQHVFCTLSLQSTIFPRPVVGRLSESHEFTPHGEDGEEDEVAFRISNSLPGITHQPVPIVSTNPPPAPAITTIVAPVAVVSAPAIPQPAQVAQATQAPAVGQFKPIYLQIRANGHNGPVQTQAPMTVAAILSRSINLPDNQKDSRLTFVGGMRYLCCHGPLNNECGCFFKCRPDLAKHGRVDHGVAQFAASDWAQIGPYNIDEMRVLRPGKTFVLRSARDPMHMR